MSVFKNQEAAFWYMVLLAVFFFLCYVAGSVAHDHGLVVEMKPFDYAQTVSQGFTAAAMIVFRGEFGAPKSGE